MLRDVVRQKVSPFGKNLLGSLKAEDRENLEGFAKRLKVTPKTLYNWLYGEHLPGMDKLLTAATQVGRLAEELVPGVSKAYDKIRAARMAELGVSFPVAERVSTTEIDGAPQPPIHSEALMQDARFLNIGDRGKRLTAAQRAALEDQVHLWIADMIRREVKGGVTGSGVT